MKEVLPEPNVVSPEDEATYMACLLIEREVWLQTRTSESWDDQRVCRQAKSNINFLLEGWWKTYGVVIPVAQPA